MANMSLGGTTFASNPSKINPVIGPERKVAKVATYSSVAFFSWGASIVGRVITLSWELMPTAQYAALQTLYAADAAVVWDPQDGSGKTYNVEILDLTGDYFVMLADAADNHRQNVTLPLLILSEVS
jgi:hypothetical protein